MVSPAYLVEVAHADTVGTERVASGLSQPLFVTAPADDFERLFILEKNTGQIKILNLSTGEVNAAPFLDLNVSTKSEQGLHGLAFDPDYAANGVFYVSFTDPSGASKILRYEASADPDVADASSAEIVSKIAQPFVNHNGGWMGFGPDGYLYYATGDGGSGNDPRNSGQNLKSPLGKMLRLDVRSGTDDFPDTANRNYAIPADNPFVGDTVGSKPVREDIWAYGLRNPWRPSFDRETGDLYIADVGQGAREEVNFQPASSDGGENYGWRLREGTIRTPGVGGPAPADSVDPVYDYGRGSGEFRGRSVTGGYVYRGPVTELQGKYFFGDFASSQIWSFQVQGGGIADLTNWTSDFTPDQGSIRGIASFGEDAIGNLYIVDIFGGEIFRVVGPTPGDGNTPTSANDSLTGTAANDTIDGLAGRDTIDGGDGDDVLLGDGGDDTVHGGGGDDTLVGGTGAGNDRFFGDAGVDVITFASASLPVKVNLTPGKGAASGTAISRQTGTDTLFDIENVIGGLGKDVITGNDRENALNGGPGADRMSGGGGNDTYIVDNVKDRISEKRDGGDGDTVRIESLLGVKAGKIALFKLANYLEKAVIGPGAGEAHIRGNKQDNEITGNEDANKLDGYTGADLMTGGGGNDTYGVDDPGDVVSEAADAGADAVWAVIDHTLGANVENLTLTGRKAITGTGNEDNNVLAGNAKGNVLDELAGDDTLNGASGNDTLTGGTGNDSLDGGKGVDLASYADAGGAVMVDLSLNGAQNTGAGGADILEAMEGVIGGDFDDRLAGGDGANTLMGGAGNDTLDGGLKGDRMFGGAGDDAYRTDTSRDRIFETAGVGTDSVESSASYALSANVEHLTLTGDGNTRGTGNNEDNALAGNAGRNTLAGGKGNDTLTGGPGNDVLKAGDGDDILVGGAGKDILVGGKGADTFGYDSVGDSGVGKAFRDTIKGFKTIEGDRIDLPGGFDFVGGDAFTGAAGELRFDKGVLLADANGDRVADMEIALPGVRLDHLDVDEDANGIPDWLI